MSQPPESPDDRHLLPANWHNAPVRYWREDRYGAFTFAWTNLALGTLGLWAPIVGAFLTRKSIPDLAQSMMASGSLYLFVIPFVASIACSVFTAAHSPKGGSRPRYLDVLKVVLLLVFAACLFLMPYQVLTHESAIGRNGALQLMVSLLGGTVGIYVYCLLKLDVDEPFTDEINRKAERLLDDANRANSKSSDFDS